MDKKQHLHNLRVRFIDLNIQYTQEMRAGKTIEELAKLRAELISVEAEILIMEQDLKR